VLLSPDFNPTSGEKSIIVIINLNSQKKASYTPELEDLVLPTAEIACLLCKKLRGSELRAMRIETLAVMHEHIIGLDNLPRILIVRCNDRGQVGLSSLSVGKNGKMRAVDGVVYVKKPKITRR